MNIFSEYAIRIKNLVKKLNSNNKLKLPDNLDGINIDVPPKGFIGDISCNVALVLSKPNKKDPLDIANLLSIEIKKNLAQTKINQMKESAIKEIKDTSIKIAIDSVKKIITTTVDKSKLDNLRSGRYRAVAVIVAFN